MDGLRLKKKCIALLIEKGPVSVNLASDLSWHVKYRLVYYGQHCRFLLNYLCDLHLCSLLKNMDWSRMGPFGMDRRPDFPDFKCQSVRTLHVLSSSLGMNLSHDLDSFYVFFF